MNEIKVIIGDYDGSFVPQGGPMDPRVAAVIRKLWELISLGIATGKSADYSRGVASGIGIPPWKYIIAESGGILLEMTTVGPPPSFKQYPLLSEGSEDIAELAYIIRLDPFRRRFMMAKEWVKYRPELKETILTLFPPTSDVEITNEWEDYFKEIIKTHGLELNVQRHKDGAIDILPRLISKKIGLQKICNLLGCELKNILAVADGVNDIEMVESTTAIAVGNAIPEIKEIVTRNGGFVATYPDGKGFVNGLLYYAKSGSFDEEKLKLIREIIEKEFPEFIAR